MAGISQETAKFYIEVGFKADKAKLEQQLEKVNKEIERLTKKLTKKLAVSDKKATQKLYDNKVKEAVKYYRKLERLERQHQAKSVKQTKSYAAKQSSAFGILARYATAGAAIGAITAGATKVIKELLAVNDALGKVAAVSGASYKDLKTLKAEVFSVSAAFGIAASEVSEFVIQMAKLGKTVEEITKLAEISASLSVILGTGMADAGTLMVTTMKQFNLTMSDASYTAGVFLKVIQESPLAIDDLRTTLQYVGAVADATGFQLHEVGAMMNFLSNAGIRASKIGTGLRNTLLQLAKEGLNVKDMFQKMNEEGITVTEALETFDKRSVTVAYNLITNWKEVEEMMGERIPTSLERLAASSATLITWSAKISIAWARVIKVFSGGLDAPSGSDVALTTKIADDLDDLGVSFADFSQAITVSFNKMPEASIADILQDAIGSSADFDSLQGDLGTTAYGLVVYVQRLKDEAIKIAEQAVAFQRAADDVENILDNVKNRAATQAEGLDVLKERGGNSLYQRLYLSMVSLFGSEEARDKLDSLFNSKTNELLVWKDYTIPQMREAIDRLKKDLGEVFKEGGNVFLESAEYKRISKTRNAYIEMICLFYKEMGVVDELCETEKKKKAARKKMLSLSLDLRLLKSELDLELTRALIEMTDMSEYEDVISNYFKGVDVEELSEEDKQGFINAIPNILLSVIENISAAYKEEKKLIEDHYLNAKGDKEEVIRRYEKAMEDLNPTDDNYEADLLKLQNDVKRILVDLNKLEEDFIKDLSDLGKKKDKTITDVTDEGDSLMKKLLGTPEENEIDLEAIFDIVARGLAKIADIYNEYQDEILNQTLDRLRAEDEALQARFAKENDYLDDMLANNIISQESYNEEKERLRREEIDKENEIGKAMFEAQKKRDRDAAIIDGIVKAAQAFATAVAKYEIYGIVIGAALAALVGVQTGIQVNAINKRKFIPVKYAEGGLVEGKSHVEGGVPFTVQGQGGYEMEGGEYVFDKQTTKKHLPLFEAIRGNKHYDPRVFASGGIIPDTVGVDSALGDLAVKAYVTDKDLKANENRRVTVKERTTIWS